MTQRFKENDPTELQIINLLLPTLNVLGIDRDTFFADAYSCELLGQVLYDLERDPMSDVITEDTYKTSFPEIHNLFTKPGTFEFYIDLFRKIYDDDVEIEFVIPDPGVLEINVTGAAVQQFNLNAREIVDDEYVYSKMVTSDTNDYIMAVGEKGIKTQAELNGLIAEISAAGIYTTCNLLTPP